jgi:hypothetical protein
MHDTCFLEGASHLTAPWRRGARVATVRKP